MKKTITKSLSGLPDHHDHDHRPRFIKERDRRSKYTIAQDTRGYMLWNVVIILNCLYTCLVYPSYTLNSFPSIKDSAFWTLALSELCFFIDICLSFFKQDLNEEGKSKHESLEEIAVRYLRSRKIKLDIISFLPLGWIFSRYDERLKFFWIIKATRLGLLNFYMRDRMLNPIIKNYIDSK